MCLRAARKENGGLVRVRALLISIILSSTANGSDEALSEPGVEDVLKYRKSRSIGGVYVGKVRPIYVDGDLFLQPVNAEVRDRASCASRDVLRLADEPSTVAFRNKFDLVLRSWLADRELMLIGKGTCSLQGDEIIFAVWPR